MLPQIVEKWARSIVLAKSIFGPDRPGFPRRKTSSVQSEAKASINNAAIALGIPDIIRKSRTR